MNSMETIFSSNKSLYRDLPLYEDHKIRRAAAGEPTLLAVAAAAESFTTEYVCKILSTVRDRNKMED